MAWFVTIGLDKNIITFPASNSTIVHEGCMGPLKMPKGPA